MIKNLLPVWKDIYIYIYSYKCQLVFFVPSIILGKLALYAFILCGMLIILFPLLFYSSLSGFTRRWWTLMRTAAYHKVVDSKHCQRQNGIESLNFIEILNSVNQIASTFGCKLPYRKLTCKANPHAVKLVLSTNKVISVQQQKQNNQRASKSWSNFSLAWFGSEQGILYRGAFFAWRAPILSWPRIKCSQVRVLFMFLEPSRKMP